MSNKTLEKILQLECLHDSKEPVSIGWLGGEVLTIPLDELKGYAKIIKENVPDAQNKLVTNLYSLTNAQIDFIKETFYSIETTYAAGLKMSLDYNEKKYQDRFAHNLKKLNDAGLLCHVNVELNDKTVEAGVNHIINLAKFTGQKSWEFDISVRFDDALVNGVSLNDYQYPSGIPLTITYKEWADYIIQFIREKNRAMKELGLRIGFINSCFSEEVEPFFNTMKTHSYLTFNPNGDVLGAPVFSGTKAAHYGNIHFNTEEEILLHPTKVMNTAYEHVGRFVNEECSTCEYYSSCKGGFSCVPVTDGSGECIGMKSIRDYVKQYKVEYRKRPDELWNPSPKFPLIDWAEVR